MPLVSGIFTYTERNQSVGLQKSRGYDKNIFYTTTSAFVQYMTHYFMYNIAPITLLQATTLMG